MTTPLELSSQVGYCPAADVYCTYTEYYGNGTVYGWRHVYIGDAVVRGAGKTKTDLVATGAYAEEAMAPAVPADIVVVPLVAELPGPEPPTEGAPLEPEPAPAPEPVPEPVPESEPAPAPAPVPTVKAPYIVKLTHPDFTVEYKRVLSVEVKDEAGTLTFSVA